MNLIQLLIVWVVTAVSFVIISKIPIGVEIDSFPKALTSAAVFGILNAIIHNPVFDFFQKPLNFLTLGLLALVVNAIIFGLAAWLVSGFRLRWGFWSALLGALALSIINSLLFNLLAQMGLATVS